MPTRHRWIGQALVGMAASLVAPLAMADTAPAPADAWAAYDADVPKTIVDLQPFRSEVTATAEDGTALRLIALNPRINGWFLLETREGTFHIENPDPGGQILTLESAPAGLALVRDGTAQRCMPWQGGSTELADARATGLPFAPICGGALYLRNKASGTRSSLEAVTDFLRDNVWQGEAIVRIVRDTLYRDAFAETGEEGLGGGKSAPLGPRPARIDDRYANASIAPFGLGLNLTGRGRKGAMSQGAWYPVAGLPGIFAGAIQPRAIAGDILTGPGNANRLDSIEGKAVDFFVAFDLDRFGLGFALGPDHPRLDWSPRPPWNVRPKGLPGPDGIKDSGPLMRSGMVSPAMAGRTVATFTAGFKRQHGAFKYGPLREAYKGRHYGFVENGAIFSKLWPDLATLYVLDDGTIGMKTWTEDDTALLPRLRHARQNGVALVEKDAETGAPVPGHFVTSWGGGNWSGSAKAELRTLRAGGCLQRHEGRSYLIYGYFSTATPSAMARTFQAYGCDYAMLLDMNALEHTYLALYPREGDEMRVEHLIEGMALIDKKTRSGALIPRFIGSPDTRDLFYMFHKEGQP